jgi:hypothetical protein
LFWIWNGYLVQLSSYCLLSKLKLFKIMLEYHWNWNIGINILNVFCLTKANKFLFFILMRSSDLFLLSKQSPLHDILQLHFSAVLRKAGLKYFATKLDSMLNYFKAVDITHFLIHLIWTYFQCYSYWLGPNLIKNCLSSCEIKGFEYKWSCKHFW